MKSHVSLGQVQCPVCLELSNSGEVLLHKHLRQTLDPTTVTGWGMCPEHQQLKDDGFVALIELERKPQAGEHPLTAPRTGQVAHIRESAWPFNIPVPPGKVIVIEVGVIDKLKGMTE